MSAADLLFSQPPLVGVPALVFGEFDDLPVVIVDVTLQAAGQITGLRGRIALRAGVVVGGAARITGLRGSMAVQYDVNVDRPIVAAGAWNWQHAGSAQLGVEAHFQRQQGLDASVRELAQRAQEIGPGFTALCQALIPMHQDLRVVCESALAVTPGPVGISFQAAIRLRADVSTRFEAALGVVVPVAVQFQAAFRDRYASVATSPRRAVDAAFGVTDSAGYAAPLDMQWGGRFQEAWAPRPGLSRISPTPVPAPVPCYVPSPHLLFDTPWSSSPHLVFACEASGPRARIVIPILRAYVTINSISLHRVDTGAELHAHGFSMSLDADSWTWSWSASLHHDAANHLGRDAQDDPAELEVVVNGIPFRLRLGRIQRDRRFSPTRWSVSGKGRAAILGAPYAPRMSFGNTAPRTAQQIMADVLTVNGVSLGWALEWGLSDWLVPEGAWAFQGSYIDAINDIAASAGGYIQPHATDAVLRVLPRYPAAPWAWDSFTPDFEIPADAAEVEGTEYVDKPAYNRVFLGGVGAGVFGPFTRAGTAGNVVAPQVTHALITHADAHRQRGLAELSDTGRQEHITLKMQVLPETGIITPGKFIRYVGDKTVMGIVRSTSIDWSRPVLRQTLGIETHA